MNWLNQPHVSDELDGLEIFWISPDHPASDRDGNGGGNNREDLPANPLIPVRKRRRS